MSVRTIPKYVLAGYVTNNLVTFLIVQWNVLLVYEISASSILQAVFVNSACQSSKNIMCTCTVHIKINALYVCCYICDWNNIRTSIIYTYIHIHCAYTFVCTDKAMAVSLSTVVLNSRDW